jgi:hypothetical protein
MESPAIGTTERAAGCPYYRNLLRRLRTDMNLFAFCLSVRGSVSPLSGEPFALDALDGFKVPSLVIAAKRFAI